MGLHDARKEWAYMILESQYLQDRLAGWRPWEVTVAAEDGKWSVGRLLSSLGEVKVFPIKVCNQWDEAHHIIADQSASRPLIQVLISSKNSFTATSQPVFGQTCEYHDLTSAATHFH